jgi:DNA polymerase-4
MASDFKKPNLCHTLFPEEVATKMWPLPVDELFFVGPSAKSRFHTLGIHTISDLANSNLTMLKHHLGNKYATLIHDYANGLDDDEVVAEEEKNKGYGNSITLAQDVTDLTTANQVLLALCETVGSRLRSAKVSASCITVEVKYADFQTKSHQTTLADVTNSTNLIYEAACKLFMEFWNHSPIRLLGVRATKLDENEFSQVSLFDTGKQEKLTKLDSAIDKIRDKFGTDAVKRASFIKDDAICKHRLGKK